MSPVVSSLLRPLAHSHSISLSPIGPSACLCSLSLYIAVVYNGITYPHPLGSRLSRLSSEGFKTHIHTVSRQCASLGRSGARAALLLLLLLLRPRPIYALVLFVVNPSIFSLPRSVYCIRALTRAWTLLQ